MSGQPWKVGDFELMHYRCGFRREEGHYSPSSPGTKVDYMANVSISR